jgi:hypothetical protein
MQLVQIKISHGDSFANMLYVYKIDELATNSKNKNVRDLNGKKNEFKRGYNDENGNLFVDSHNILTRWKNYFSQLLKVHRASNIRQI